MKFLRDIFSNSFNILTQNLTLMWPIFGLAGICLLVNQDVSVSSAFHLDVIAITRMAVWFSVVMAFVAGMAHMAHQAAYRVLHPNKEKLPSPLDSLTLLKEFFPGVSAFFPSFFFGGLILVAFVALLLFGGDYILTHYWGGYPDSVNTLFMMMLEQKPTAEIEHYMRGLSMAELAQLLKIGMLSFAGYGIFGIFFLFTMFWPAYVITYDISGPMAYVKSIGQVIRDPLNSVAIFMAYVTVLVVLTVLLSNTNIFLSMLLFLFIMMCHTWLMLMVNYYVIAKAPAGQIKTNSDNQKLSLNA